MSSVVIAKADDWEGLYIAGALQAQGHHLEMVPTIQMILTMMPAVIAQDVTSRWVDLDWMAERSDLPSNIDDVEWEVRTP